MEPKFYFVETLTKNFLTLPDLNELVTVITRLFAPKQVFCQKEAENIHLFYEENKNGDRTYLAYARLLFIDPREREATYKRNKQLLSKE